MAEKPRQNVEDWLNPEKQLTAKLESGLSEIKAPQILLVIIESEHYSAVQNGLLGLLQKRFQSGVFVSVNKALAQLVENETELQKMKNIAFIDLVSEGAGTEKLEAKNAVYLESPQNLLELAVQVEQRLQSLPAERFVVVDSVSTLLLYNKPDTLEKFVHTLAGKIRAKNAVGIFLTVRLRENKDILQVLSQFCDHTIEIEDLKIR